MTIIEQLQSIESNRKDKTSRKVFDILSEISDEELNAVLDTLSVEIPDSVKDMRSAKYNWVMWKILDIGVIKIRL